MKKTILQCLIGLISFMIWSQSFAAPFTPGNIVVYRVGDGVGSLVNTGNAVFIDEYTPNGVLVQSIALPESSNGTVKGIVASGIATSEGTITLSGDGKYLVVTGYDGKGGTSLSGTTGSAKNRVVGRIDDKGVLATTGLSQFASGNNPRSAVTPDGTNFWAVGGAGGVRFFTFGDTNTTQISTTVTNIRAVNAFGGQLYIATSSGSAVRIGSVGTGLPTTTGQTITNLPGIPTTGSPYSFYFFDQSNTIAGADVLYIADDGATAGIQKYSLVNNTWTLNGTINAPGVRGLTGLIKKDTIMLFGTTGGSGATGGGAIYRFKDFGGYNAAVTGKADTLATAATNTAFRGIAFAPSAPQVTNWTLQLLHTSDMEASISAVTNAPAVAAIIDTLEDTYPNTLKLAGGDNYIPSPFLNASQDTSMNTAIRKANASIYNDGVNTSKFISNYARVDLTIMNAIGYQASAVGNHEFDLGTSVFREAIAIGNSFWTGAQFPYLSCNLDFSGDVINDQYTKEIRPNTDYRILPPQLASATFRRKIAPATVITVNGEKIGVVGATTQILETITSVAGVRVKGVKADNMDVLATYIQPYIDTLTTVHGCNKIILLSHLQQISLEKSLVGKLKGVDIIVAAGSHTLQADANDVLRTGDTKKDDYPTITKNKDNDDALIVCTDGEWKYVGRLVVDFDAQGKIVVSSLDNTINGAYASDTLGMLRVYGSNYAKAFAPGTKGKICADLTGAIQSVITTQDGDIYGKSSVFMEGRRTFVRTEETNFGSVTAEANLWYAKKIDPTVMVSIKNGGGIRSAIGEVKVDGATNIAQYLPPQANPIANKKTGEVSRLDILNSLRFNNGLTLVTVTAAQLLQTLNFGIALWSVTATRGEFPQVAGVRFRFDPKRPGSGRITELMIVDSVGNVLDVIAQRGAVVGDPNRLIRVVSLNFLVDGGDSYPFPSFVTANPTQANKVALVKTDTDPKTGTATFANDGSEQDAFAEFMKAKFSVTPFAKRDTVAKGDFTIQNLNFHSDFFASSANDVLYTTNSGVKVYNGGFGSDMILDPKNKNTFYLLTDRGPNADSAGVTSPAVKIFSNPEFAPQIGKFVLKGDSIKLVKKIELKRADGVTKLTGLPNPIGAGNTGERARDLAFNLLPNDAEGIDSEGLVIMPDGSFWISDEYGPHLLHVDSVGKSLERVNAFGPNINGRKLPAVFAKRRANRGMEGLTITPSGKYLVGAMQSTMWNPTSTGLNAKTTRIVFYEIATGATKQYVYVQEANNGSNSGISAISDTTFLLLERDGNFQGGSPAAVYKRFYKINISGATDVSDANDGATGKLYVNGTKTLEQLTAGELTSEGIKPIKKTLISDLLTDIPYYPHDKLEGLAILNDSMIVVSNDDDFGVNPNASGSYDQKILPLNGRVDRNTIYYVKLRNKLSNLGGLVSEPTSSEEQVTFESTFGLEAYPNPTSDVVYFNKTVTNGVLYNTIGQKVLQIQEADDLYMGGLRKGIYILKTDKESLKIVVK